MRVNRFALPGFAVAAVLAAAALAAVDAGQAHGSRYLIKGMFDEAQTLGQPEKSLPLLKQLRTEAVRTNLNWRNVAPTRPTTPTKPNDPAYRWAQYDNMVIHARQNGIKVVFSIVGTPGWANGGKRWNRAPKKGLDLRNFAYAAAKRYSGTFVRKEDDTVLPAVRHWLAWNEPNNPVFLFPQYRRAGKRWVVQSAANYARICNAVVAGVKGTLIRGQRVACGVTAPRGNNAPRSKRPSVSPLAFLRAMKRYGARGFDAYAHHPYYGSRFETPTSPPKGGLKATAVTLGNIDVLVRELTRLYGRKRLWITEYGYQTRPQDRLFGVTYRQQARYLAQAFAIARRHPRIDMMLWFLLRDQPRVQHWQSGFFTARGARKPSFFTFRAVKP